MLYRHGLILLFFSLMMPCIAGDFEPFAGPAPMAVLIQENPSTDVIGAETPRIAIYDNGDVVYARTFPKQGDVYFYAKLSFEALASLRDRLRNVTEMGGLKTAYSLTKVADQSRALFYLHVGNQIVATSVYGLNPDGLRHETTEAGGDQIPASLRQLYRYLSLLDFPGSRPWRPTYVEAMLFPYVLDDNPPGVTLNWPATWPDLNSNRVIKRNQGYSIFLDGSKQEDLKKFLAFEGDKGAVVINQQKWSVSWRPVFPSEPEWRKALSPLEGD